MSNHFRTYRRRWGQRGPIKRPGKEKAEPPKQARREWILDASIGAQVAALVRKRFARVAPKPPRGIVKGFK